MKQKDTACIAVQFRQGSKGKAFLPVRLFDDNAHFSPSVTRVKISKVSNT